MSITSRILVSSLVLVQALAKDEPSSETSPSNSSSTEGGHAKTNTSSPQTGSGGPPQYNPALQAAMEAGNMQFAGMGLIVLVSVAAALLLYRIATSTVRTARVLSCMESEKQTYWRQSARWFALLKKHLLYAPLFRTRHQAEIQFAKGWSLGILPTRFQTLFLTLLITMNVVYCVIGIEWDSVGSTVMLGHLRNRTGTIAVANMIPLALLAGRNNPLIILLNIPYGAFNLVHRWLGRIIVAESIVHTSCWIAGRVASGGWESVAQSLATFGQVPQTGLIAVCAFLAIVITSMVVFRRAFYELWYHIHIVLAVVATVGLWYHLDTFPQQQGFIRAFILGWVIERVIRLLILLYRNVGAGGTHALVEYLPGDAVKVTLTLARPWTFRPGQHIFLTIPSIGLWTTHPFSLAWSTPTSNPTITLLSNLDPEKATGIYKSNAFAKEAQMSLTSAQSSTISLPTTTNPTVTAIIHRRTGFTQKLWSRIRSTPNGQFRTRAFVEGPYTSAQPSLASYGTVVLFAGGVGITHQISYLRTLLQGYATATVACRRLLLVWTVQSPEHLEWIRPWMAEILALEGRRQVLRVQLYITRSAGVENLRSTSASVQMFLGRPNVEAIVAHESKNQVGAMAVSVCGPGSLSDGVRLAVRERQGQASVDFVEQDFSW